MLGRSIRRAVALLLMFVGCELVGATVDISPLIGSPQIDYPAINFDWPFLPQLAIHWFLVGLGGAVIAALAMAAWSDERTSRPNVTRLGLIWAAWFAFRAGLGLAGFLAWGSMGPLHVQQPIFRFAVVNGAISATVITVAYWGVCLVGRRVARQLHPLAEFGICIGAAAFICLVVVAAIALLTGLPWLALVERLAPLVAIIVTPASILIVLRPQARGAAST